MIYTRSPVPPPVLGLSQAALPNLPDCQRLEDHVLDSADPRAIFGTSTEIGQRATPVRVGNLRSHGPIPTHHFASNALKVLEGAPPLRIFPYEGEEGCCLHGDGF